MDKQLIKRVLHPKKSLEVSKKPTTSISTYKGELTTEGWTKAAKIISDSFPDLDKGFYDQFNRLILKEDFGDNRLLDAVDYVVKNCIYPRPTIANFLSYDNRIKLYSYNDIRDMCQPGYSAFDYYELIEDLNKYAAINDIKKYGL